MISEKNICGGILCGGQSRRMKGVNKLLLNIDGIPIIKRVYNNISFLGNILFSVSDEVRISEIKDALGVDLPGSAFIKDNRASFGPVEGIYELLKNCPGDAVFIIPGDLPFLSEQCIRAFLSIYADEDIQVFSDGNRVHPACGIYSKRVLPFLESMLSSDEHRIRIVFDKCKTKITDISELGYSPNELFNINTPDDFKKINL